MVLFKCIKRTTAYGFYKFTFQYGSIQIVVKQILECFKNKFTFQYGSIQMKHHKWQNDSH